MRKGSIYIIKNSINNKVYIGQTVQSVKDRFRQHLKPSSLKKRGSYKIYNAINKYGYDVFYVECLENGINPDDLDNKEIKYIEYYNSYEEGYNSTRGGDSKTIAKVQDIIKLKQLFNKGLTHKELGKVFGVNYVTIQRTLHSLELIRVNKVTKSFLIENKNYKTNIQMAAMLGVHNMTISRAFKKYGIERGRGCSNKLKCIDYPIEE